MSFKYRQIPPSVVHTLQTSPQKANQNQISYRASVGRVNESLFAASVSRDQASRYAIIRNSDFFLLLLKLNMETFQMGSQLILNARDMKQNSRQTKVCLKKLNNKNTVMERSAVILLRGWTSNVVTVNTSLVYGPQSFSVKFNGLMTVSFRICCIVL